MLETQHTEESPYQRPRVGRSPPTDSENANSNQKRSHETADTIHDEVEKQPRDSQQTYQQPLPEEDSKPATTRHMKRRRHITPTDESGQEELNASPRRQPRRHRRHISPYHDKNMEYLNDQESSDQEALGHSGSEDDGAGGTAEVARDDAVENEGHNGKESRKIHLDLDMEAEVGLNAKIQGDVTLGLTE